MKLTSCIIIAVTFLSSNSVRAEFLDEFRIQYALGQATGKVDAAIMNSRLNDLGYQASATVSDLTRSAHSWLLDYQFNPYLSLQAGYFDLGEVRTKISGTPADIRDFLQSTNVVHPRSADGYKAGLQLQYPLSENWDLRLAYHRNWQKSYYLSYTANLLEQLPRNSRDNNWTVGLGYQWSERWQFVIEYSPQTVQNEDIRVWQIGINYRFWQQEPNKNNN